MKNKKSAKKTDSFNLLVYVEKCSPKMKKFESEREMGEFIDNFYKTYPDYMSSDSDYWIDFAVTGVTGEVHFFTDGVELE
jgi:hypothetical protein